MLLAANGSQATDVILAIAVFSPFPIISVLGWIFWRAAKRDREQAAAALPAPPERDGTGG